MEQKLTNSGPLREPADKHSIYTRRRQVSLTHLLPHIPRNELDGRLHFGHHALGFLDASEADLTESFLLGDGAQCVDLRLDVTRNQLPVTTATAIQVDDVVRVTNGANALANLRSLPGETLLRLARCLHLLLAPL
jgi:hypothetical protein